LAQYPGNWPILLNGVSAAGGGGSELEVTNGGHMYALGAGNNWYIWQSGSWALTGNPNPPPPRPVVPTPTLISFNPPNPAIPATTPKALLWRASSSRCPTVRRLPERSAFGPPQLQRRRHFRDLRVKLGHQP
jgi:hypothetical protein